MFLYQRALLFILYYIVHITHFIRCLFVKHRKLSHQERVSRCYKFLHYAVQKTGAFSVYTEGHYSGHENEYESVYDYYEKAQVNQANDLLDAVHILQGQQQKNSFMKLLDSGCGNGNLSHTAKYERGVNTLGLTLSPEEVNVNKEQGLDARCLSYKCLRGNVDENQFDAIISNGSSEHLYDVEEQLVDEGRSAIETLLKDYWSLLKPGGLLCFTWINLREHKDARKVAMDAWKHPVESVYWHGSVLIHFYSGWYPVDGLVEKIAEKIGYELIEKKDTTKDYLLTSLVWRKDMAKALRSLKGLFWISCIVLYTLVTDPIYLYYCVAYKWGSSWSWQFQEKYDSRTKQYKPPGTVHYLMTFKKPLSSD